MAKCLYCHGRKGKRDCPALDGSICPSCCGTHRLVRIECASDCVYLHRGETYQDERRFDKARSHGREYLLERSVQFHDDGAFAFALAVESVLHRTYAASPHLTDAEVLRGLESLRDQLGRIVVIEAVPHPIAVRLLSEFSEEGAREEFGDAPDELKRHVLDRLAECVRRFASSAPGGRGYGEFVAHFFGQLRLETPAAAEPETPSGGGRIVLP